MATDSRPARSPGALPGDDLSALAWVHGELRRSLEAAHKALRRYLKESDTIGGSDVDAVDPSVLRGARAQIHQAVGALELVGMPALARMLRASEAAVQRLAARPALVDAGAVDTVERASFAALDFIARQLAGKPVSPVMLFPQYRAVQQLAAADRIHPADLWPLDFQWHALPAEPGVPPRASDDDARGVMEGLVLALMRGADRGMLAAASGFCAELGAGAAEGREATLWRMAAAVYQAQALGLLATDVYAKRLASRLLAQLRLAVQGQHDVSERLAQDLLFFCAHARPAEGTAPRLAAVRRAWGLEPHAGADYETPRLGRFDPALLALARKRVASAKEAWSAAAAGESRRLAALGEQFALVGESLTRLLPVGERLAQALQGAAAQAMASGQAPATPLAMEVATAILYLEAALDDGDLDTPELGARVQRLAQRVDEVRAGGETRPLEPWMEELYRRVSDRQTMGSVVHELRAALSEIEKEVDQYFRNPAERQVLLPVPGQFGAMRGVLSVLGLEQASQAVLHMRDEVEALARAGLDAPPAAPAGTFDRLADNLGALGFLIDMLNVQPALARSLFRFDPASGVFAAVMGQGEATADGVRAASAAQAAAPAAPVQQEAAAIAEAAGREEVPGEAIERRLERLAQQALAAEQPALARTAQAARAALHAAGDAAARRQARAELALALAAFAPAAAVEPAAAPSLPPRTTPAAAPGGTGLEDDAEMREVFIEEAREVVADAGAALERLADAPEHAGDMTAVRRAFHTLKGSSRMVGLRDFGEAAWACEQLYNARLADQPRLDAPLRAFTAEALAYLGAWVEAVAAGRDAGHHSAAVVRSAETLRLEGRRLPIEPARPDAAPLASAAPRADIAPGPSAAPESAEPQPFAATAAALMPPAVEPAELFELPELTELPELPELTELPERTGLSEPAPLPQLPEPIEAVAAPGPPSSPELGTAIEPAADLIEARENDEPAESFALPEVAELMLPEPLPALSADEVDEVDEAAGRPSPIETMEPATGLPIELAGIDFDLEPGREPEFEPLPLAATAGAAPAPIPLSERIPDLPSEADLELAAPAAPALPEVSFELDLGALDEEQASGQPAEEGGLDLPAEEAAAALASEPSPEPAVGFDLVIDLAPDRGLGLARSEAAEAPDDKDAADLALPPPAAAAEALPAPPPPAAAAEAPPPAPSVQAGPAPTGTQPAAAPAQTAYPAQAEDQPAEIEAQPTEAEAPTAAAAAPTPHFVRDLAEPLEDEQIKVIGPLRISIPLFNIYLNEADELSRRLVTEIGEWSVDALGHPVSLSAEALAHKLAGSSATVGYAELSVLARALEHALARSHALGPGREGESELFGDAADEIRRLLHQFAAGFLRPAPQALLERLADHERWPAERPVAPIADAAAEPLSSVGSVAVSAFAPLDAAAEGGAAAAAPDAFDDDEDIDAVDAVDAELFPIFEEEAGELLPQLQARLREWHEHPGGREAAGAAMRTLHTFKGGARLAGAMHLGEMAHRLETAIEHLAAHEDVSAARIEPLLARCDAMAGAFEALRGVPVEGRGESGVSIAPTPAVPAVAPTPAAAPEHLPEWETESAPVAESVAQPAAQSGVEPVAEPAPAPAPEPTAAAAAQRAALEFPVAPAAAATAPAAPAPAARRIDWSRFTRAAVAPEEAAERGSGAAAVRVRAALLDRLVNQAGEVAITRERIAADVRQLQGSLAELTESLERMRRHLRDIELQAESQIATRMESARAAGEAFDPLEMDRFTRFQELTRFMAESVNDVATLQRSLQRTVQGSEDELAAQARLTRDLQDDLLRTRMVEFESLAERLYRTVRQAAKETGKQVRLDIVGGAIEIDRGVLERMVGSFEHLLRNSVAHGIEAPAVRRAVGKDATGRIRIGIAQSGNEVAVEIGDDGAGFDYERIRRRGVERGLVAPEAEPGEAELAQLLFQPGFSTALAVTELAGRGVGLDVVRAEVGAMGGRIETASARGQGTRFRLLLPLTTAVTQVVMLRSGTLTVAVPSTLVEIVRRIDAAQTERAYAGGSVEHDGEAVPFFRLAALLQAGTRGEGAARSHTVVIVRSAAQRVAVHVDEVIGNQEVVVKNVGPQLARLPGLAGVTLLPSGAVALIYNPVALAALYGDEARRLMRRAAPEPAAVADAVPRAPLVLVVDDSLTVRRVTQRVLQREGYRVATAKDGLEALERLAEERPVVLLSDIEMPRMDGFDLLRNVRADERLAGLPVVMITSRIAAKHRDYAIELGADHYLGKPFAEEELLALVARFAGADIPT